MTWSNRILAALTVAGALALASCQSAAGENAQSNSNVKILAKGPNGHPSEVRIDGKNWAVCSKKQETKNCINPVAAGLA
jgi:hypothetical protein